MYAEEGALMMVPLLRERLADEVRFRRATCCVEASPFAAGAGLAEEGWRVAEQIVEEYLDYLEKDLEDRLRERDHGDEWEEVLAGQRGLV